MEGKQSPQLRDIFRQMYADAIRLQSAKIGSEHFVLAVLARPEANPGRAILRSGTRTSSLKNALEDSVRGTANHYDGDAIVATDDAELAMKAAKHEADLLKSSEIDPNHVLLAILSDTDAPCTSILGSYNITYDWAKRALFEA